MEKEAEQREAVDNHSPFIDGYFTQRLQTGDRPRYGYPTNHLPETTVARMEVHTTFIVSRKSKK
jgi:hypothetical protein